MAKSTLFSILLLILSSSITCNATIADDEKDCADQLQNLAACIPYVSGAAKKPTPECCADAEKVRSSKPKCLCVLIVESADPSLALPINTTLALRMPAACDSDAKVSDCPGEGVIYNFVPHVQLQQRLPSHNSLNSSSSLSLTKSRSDKYEGKLRIGILRYRPIVKRPSAVQLLQINPMNILKLSHDSQDAKIFKDPSGDSSRAIAPASSSTAAAASNSTPASADAKIASKNNARRLQSVFLLTVSIASMSCNLLFY